MPDTKKSPMEVETPVGTIIVTQSIDPNNPGIYVDLKRPGTDYTLGLACIECQDHTNKTSLLVTHVWGNALQEDSTHDIVHESVDEYFEKEG